MVEVAALVVAVLTALGTSVAWWVERRERKAADAASVERADQAQRTADEAADTSRRSAEATERMAQLMEADAQTQAQAAAQAAWKVTHASGDTYLVSNAGTATAYDVQVDTGTLTSVRRTHPGDQRPDVWQPGEAFYLLVVRAWGYRSDVLTVTWATEPGGTERKTWSRPLPPRR